MLSCMTEQPAYAQPANIYSAKRTEQANFMDYYLYCPLHPNFTWPGRFTESQGRSASSTTGVCSDSPKVYVSNVSGQQMKTPAGSLLANGIQMASLMSNMVKTRSPTIHRFIMINLCLQYTDQTSEQTEKGFSIKPAIASPRYINIWRN